MAFTMAWTEKLETNEGELELTNRPESQVFQTRDGKKNLLIDSLQRWPVCSSRREDSGGIFQIEMDSRKPWDTMPLQPSGRSGTTPKWTDFYL